METTKADVAFHDINDNPEVFDQSFINYINGFMDEIRQNLFTKNVVGNNSVYNIYYVKDNKKYWVQASKVPNVFAVVYKYMEVTDLIDVEYEEV